MKKLKLFIKFRINKVMNIFEKFNCKKVNLKKGSVLD